MISKLFRNKICKLIKFHLNKKLTYSTLLQIKKPSLPAYLSNLKDSALFQPQGNNYKTSLTGWIMYTIIHFLLCLPIVWDAIFRETSVAVTSRVVITTFVLQCTCALATAWRGSSPVSHVQVGPTDPPSPGWLVRIRTSCKMVENILG